MSDFTPLTHYFNMRGAQHIILHGTEVDWPTAHAIFQGQTAHEASCHYAIDQQGNLTQYVDTDMRAWHAGVSYWGGVKRLNSSSIGIEMECISKSAKFDGDESTYSDEQIATLIPLVRRLVEQHEIEQYNILAHGDVAPNRKWDPGIHFPWQGLAKHGIGLWHDLEPMTNDPVITDNRQLSDFRRNLTLYGYTNDLAVAGEQHQNVIKAFQTHFLPWNITGQATEQSIAALDVLLAKKYGSFDL